jgi:hypothetical protein
VKPSSKDFDPLLHPVGGPPVTAAIGDGQTGCSANPPRTS